MEITKATKSINRIIGAVFYTAPLIAPNGTIVKIVKNSISSILTKLITLVKIIIE